MGIEFDCPFENLLQASEGHVVVRLALVDPVDEQFERLVDFGEVVRNRIRPSTAGDGVCTSVAVDEVVAVFAEQGVGSGASEQGIVAQSTEDGVIAAVAVERVVAVLTQEAVVSSSPVNQVVAVVAVENVINHFDYHATLMHLFGIDPADLVYLRNGREQSLLDGQPGEVVEGLLAV